MKDKALDLFYVLKNCKEGNCTDCDRRKDHKSSNTYPCVKQLLQDCFDWFDEYLES